MQPERFHISLKKVPFSSPYFTKQKELSFNSYQEALTEKIRLQIFDNIKTSGIRCGESRDFDVLARATYPNEFKAWLQARDDERIAKDDERCRRLRDNEIERQARIQQNLNYQRHLQACQVKDAHLDKRRQLDRKLLSGELSRAEYFAAVEEWDAGREKA